MIYLLLNKLSREFQERTRDRVAHYLIEKDIFSNKEKTIIQKWGNLKDKPNGRFYIEQKEKVDQIINEWKLETSLQTISLDKNSIKARRGLAFLSSKKKHNYYKDPNGYWVYTEDSHPNLCKYYKFYKDESDMNKGTPNAFTHYIENECTGMKWSGKEVIFNDEHSTLLIKNMKNLKVASKKRFIIFKNKIFDGNTFEETTTDTPVLPRHNFDFDYDPNAKLTPKAKDELLKWANHDKQRMYDLLDTIGYTMFPNIWKIGVWFIGPADAGKTTFIKEILKPIHKTNLTTINIFTAKNHEREPIVFSTLNISPEPEGRNADINTMKQFISDDPLSINPKHRSVFKVEDNEKPAIIINSNNFLKMSAKTSITKKIKVINFVHKFSKSDIFKPFSDKDLQSIILVAFNRVLKYKKQLPIANLDTEAHNRYISRLKMGTENYISKYCLFEKNVPVKNRLVIEKFIKLIQNDKKNLGLEFEDEDELELEIEESVRKRNRYEFKTIFNLDGKEVVGFKGVRFLKPKKIETTKTIKRPPTEEQQQNYLNDDRFEEQYAPVIEHIKKQSVPVGYEAEEMLYIDAEQVANQNNLNLTKEQYLALWAEYRDGALRIYTTPEYEKYTEWQQKEYEKMEHEWKLENDPDYAYENSKEYEKLLEEKYRGKDDGNPINRK